VNVATFLRALGFIYVIAFLSFGLQAIGLIGSHGLLPLGDFLKEAGFWDSPSVFWLKSSDAAIRAVWLAGVLAALAAFIGISQRAMLAVCFVLWLSICSVGQDFLSFQWDLLLLETGFLALFAGTSVVRVWLFRWLIFRLMFSSGVVKLLSGDPTWRNFTAMSYHFETQPLPTPPAWYVHQLPLAFQKASTALVLFSELAVPFLFFAPKRFRRIGAWITIALQLLIMLTGNYTFFNLLTIALTMWLFIEPKGSVRGAVDIALLVVIGGATVLTFLATVGLPTFAAPLRAIAPFRIVNEYGLFAVMTTTRPEIIVEGSNDNITWQAYEFRYKPGDVYRAPPIVEPFQPRLDWQMWFASLGRYEQNPWFTNLMIRILQGEPAVLRLLRYNPFPTSPPKYVRARLYLYQFTHRGSAWWRREEQGLYFPAVSLK
jgi:hypothetical protein